MIYNIPPDTKEKNKLIGGVLNINQMFWLMGGGALGAVFFILFSLGTENVAISIFFFLVGVSLSLPFVFYKKGDLTLFQYISRKYKFNQKTFRLINKRIVK